MKNTKQTQERIESERPTDGVRVPTRSNYEIALYAMPNGSHFATLVDGSEGTWEAYCNELAKENAKQWRNLLGI